MSIQNKMANIGPAAETILPWRSDEGIGKQTPSHGSKQRCLYDKGHTEIGEILWNSSEPTQGLWQRDVWDPSCPEVSNSCGHGPSRIH